MTVPLFNSDDVAVIFGDEDTVVDLTGVRALSTASVQGGGQDASLRPIGSMSPEVVPVTIRLAIQGAAFDGDTVQRTADVDRGGGHVAVVLGASGCGWVLPADVYDTPGTEAQTEYPNANVATTSVMWAQRGLPLVATTALQLDGSSAVTVPALGGRTPWLAITKAGSVDGSARKVGVYEADDISAGSAAVSAEGWLMLVAPLTPGGS